MSTDYLYGKDIAIQMRLSNLFSNFNFDKKQNNQTIIYTILIINVLNINI
jgi:hypothetical protein